MTPGSTVIHRDHARMQIVSSEESRGRVFLWPSRATVKADSCKLVVTREETMEQVWAACGVPVMPDLTPWQLEKWDWNCGRKSFCNMLLSPNMSEYVFEKDEWLQEVLDMVQKTEE